MITFPNAKINFGLDVVCRRADGYHDISTMFYPIPLTDVLEMVEAAPMCGTSLHVYGNAIDCPVEKNLVMKAYRAFAAHYSVPEVEFHLSKQIPDGAGLGGGSSDAAFALCMLRDTYAPHVADSDIAHIAASIGADCPFFIYDTPMFATGIGDILTPAPPVLEGYTLLLIKPDVYVSTKEAYSHIVPAQPALPIETIVREAPSMWRSSLKNDFEPGVFARFTELGSIKQKLYEAGALYASMSGSGSSIFGIFDSVNLAENCFADFDFEQKYILQL